MPANICHHMWGNSKQEGHQLLCSLHKNNTHVVSSIILSPSLRRGEHFTLHNDVMDNLLQSKNVGQRKKWALIPWYWRIVFVTLQSLSTSYNSRHKVKWLMSEHSPCASTQICVLRLGTNSSTPKEWNSSATWSTVQMHTEERKMLLCKCYSL